MRMSSLASVALLLLGPLLLAGCATWGVERKYPPIGQIIEVDGEEVHLLDLGPRDSAAAPVVLIHGASVNLRDMQIAFADRLAADRRVVIIDRAGRGYSSRPPDGWRLEEQARLIHGALGMLAVENPIVVGQSFGGAVALSYALNHPDSLSGLALLAPASHEWPGGVAWYNAVSGWPVIGVAFRRIVLPIYAPLAASGGVERSFKPDPAPPNYYDRAGLPLLFRSGDFKSNAEDLRRVKAQIIEMSKRYGSITVPTVIVAGDADTTVSPDLHAKALARDIDGSRLVILPDTGHALHHAETGVIIDLIEALGP